MKHFLFILLSYFSSCFYVSLLSQEDDPNRYTNEHLRNLGITPQGKVKSVEKFIYHYDTKNGKEVKIFPKNTKVERMPVHSRYIFDKKGNIIEFYNYYTDGKLFHKIFYQYNADNLLTKADEYKYIEENNPQHTEEEIFYEGKVMISKKYKINGNLFEIRMLFDKNKRKKAISEYRNNTLINKNKYSYNSKGNITYEKNKSMSLLGDEAYDTWYTYTKEGTLLAEKKECYAIFCFYTTYKYLANNEVYEETTYTTPLHDEKDISDRRTRYYIYDSKGAIVEIQTYKGEDFRSYHCMENDKEVETYSYFLEGEVIKTLFSYDKDNQLIKKENFNLLTGDFTSGTYYTYDEKGNLLQIDDGQIPSPNRTIYHYDKFNNCTEEIYYKNNKRAAIVERIFTYY
ncbi:RHS repeat protein [Capnocytophaga gingivalis]|uniref:RHS repeat protein n=1 Tax=Capnocytophaga gingivalis TaxID=1017 RepID=A0ABU5Y976_9FLAO|nr:RHS repeat protein [Capnocytophaga gingivalis]MEB3040330.1 RHS repeat protein [Capnocytophaga gingivalis]